MTPRQTQHRDKGEVWDNPGISSDQAARRVDGEISCRAHLEALDEQFFRYANKRGISFADARLLTVNGAGA